MTDAPERIWVQWPHVRGAGLAFSCQARPPALRHEYVRADRITALGAENGVLRTEKHADAEAIAALTAERDRAIAERDEALRRRDAWKARAEGHTEIVNALKAKTAGKDSRTLSRALLGAAFNQCEAERDRLAALLVEAKEALQSSEESIVTFMGVHGYTKESGAQVILDQIRATLAAIKETDR